MKTKESEEHRKAERKPFKGNVKLFVSPDTIRAESIDLSENGIRLVTMSPLTMRIQRETDGGVQQNEARLVWAKKINGAMEYGFEYTSVTQ